MADIVAKKYLDLAGLQEYDAQIKKYSDKNDAATLKSAKDYTDNRIGELGTDDEGVAYANVKAYVDDKNAAATSAVDDLEKALAAVAKSGKAADVSVEDTANNFEATTVEGVLAELASDNGTLANAIEDITKVNGTIDTKVKAAKDEIEGFIGDIPETSEAETVIAYVNEKVAAAAGDASKVADDLAAYIESNDVAVKAAQDAADAAQDDVDALETLVGTLPEGATATTVVGYAKELADAAKADADTANKVSIVEKSEGLEDSVLKSYTFYQGGTEEVNKIGTINIAKDLVVTAGEVVKVAEGEVEGLAAGTYLKLTIANQETPVYINVLDLVNDFTVEQSASQIQLAISDTREISAAVVAKSITKTELADAVVTEIEAATTAIGKGAEGETAGTGLTGRIEVLEEAIGEGGGVSEQIKAAIEELDATVTNVPTEEGAEAPIVAVTVTEVDGKLTSVEASIKANTFDKYGDAEAVKTELLGTAEDDPTEKTTVYAAINAAAEVAADLASLDESLTAISTSEIDALFGIEPETPEVTE